MKSGVTAVAAILCSALVAHADDNFPGPLSPEDSLKSMRPRPGFRVELMAAEPLVMDPVAFEWGPDAKLWVVEMGDYPLGLDGKGKPGGRVRFLEDTEGDAKYDKSTLFLDNIPFPTGVLPWRKGVLVTAAPDIFYAEDVDSDGKADKREVLYTGFAEGNQQHRINGLVRGLDGWIYCANGESGGKVKSMKTGETVDIRGRDLRINPATGALEAVSGQSQFGRSCDDWGNWFGCSNTKPMYHYALDEHYQKRNPHYASPDPRVHISVNPGSSPVFPTSKTLPRFNSPNAAYHFTSACAAMIYRDTLFGAEFTGNAFISEPVHNLIHREIVTASGTTFTSRRADDEQESEFLTSTDNWFRPAMLKTGPDGALWIADMYRQTIEHPEWIPKAWQDRLDLRAGHDKGRIYRVFPVDAKPREFLRLDRIETEKLPYLLEYPISWVRDTSAALIMDRLAQDESSDELLTEVSKALAVIQKRSRTPQARIHALWLRSELSLTTADELLNALKAPDRFVRKHAVELTVQWLKRQGSTAVSSSDRGQVVSALLDKAADPSPQVRLQAAYALGEIDDPRTSEIIAGLLLVFVEDRYLTAAAMSSLNARNCESVLTAVLRLQSWEKSPPGGALAGELIRQSAAMAPSAARNAVTSIVSPYAKNGGTEREEEKFEPAAGAIAAFPRLGDLLAELRKAKDVDAKFLVRDFDILFSAARRHAMNEFSSEEARLAAVGLLGRSASPQDAEDLSRLAALLQPRHPPELRAAALRAIVELRPADTPVLLMTGWTSYSGDLRSQTLDALLNRPEWRAALVVALEEKTLAAVDFDAPRRQRLLTGLTAEQRERAEKVLAGAVQSNRQKVVETYRAALSMEGDAERGAKLFAKTCAGCHKLGKSGHDVGPDLGAVKDKSAEALLTALFDPNRAVESRYLNYVAVTKDGRTVTGLLAAETATSLTLRGPEAKEQTVLRSDLEELAGTARSLMPDGLEKDLTVQDTADLIAHITAITQPMPPPQRKPATGP